MIDKVICFPNAKINIGLDIVRRRSDGYHDIRTLFYPINITDAMEIMPSDEFVFDNRGIKIDCETEKNLCFKAYKMLKDDFDLPPVKFVLYKHIPFGSGLGAGSADAAFTIKMLNDMFSLKLSTEQMVAYASRLGADCAFFIHNRPMLAEGTGNIFHETGINLSGKVLVLAIPQISVNTARAYANCHPMEPEFKLEESLKLPLEQWKDRIKNDFEPTVFAQNPVLMEIKQKLYEDGAVFAQMSGSGSSIYGIFDAKPQKIEIPNCKNEIIELK
ncbi:MAG: 4-(cytidine 5'-diphospho)-2-C-methyl-D-erythritol kinase [Bacteroidales bacterium]|nr:4-(cytidine 5'-diphospho)-2-C-methyl-D-erythritol kinase [Bacteroidales bacterium]